MKFRLACLGMAAALLCIPATLFAQDTASVTGTVTDGSGAAIPNAQVTVSLADKGFTRTTTTNGSGDFLVAAVPIGAVDVSVAAQGFKKYQAKGVVLSVAEKARIDITMEVGAANVEVTVEGNDVAQVETQSSELSGTVTSKQVSQLELNGRNFTQLVTLVPGVSNQTGADEAGVGITGSVSYSGRTEYNNWEVDGGDNMDNGSNASLNVYPSLDAIAEFRVLTSSYGAQYGRNGGGTIEVETKSGTNQFHGSADYFGRNELFNAYNFFDDPDSSKPSYKKHDWGYTVGGPVSIPGVYNAGKDKTFFFWSQEWRREKNPSTFLSNVPSDLERAGNFSDLCGTPGVLFARAPADPGDPLGPLPPGTLIEPDCPAAGQGSDPRTFTTFANNTVLVDPNAALLLPLIPSANSTNAGFPAFRGSVSEPTTWREELFKIDQNIGSKVRASFRYIHDSWHEVEATPLWLDETFPTIQTQFSGPAISLVARVTANVSPTLLNEFVASYTTDHITLINTGYWAVPSGFNMPGLFNNGFGGRIPGINLGSGNEAYGGGFYEDPAWIPQGPYNSNPTYTYRDNVTKIIGKHNLIFGAYFVAAQKNELDGFAPSVNGQLNFDPSSSVSTGNGFADLLTGQIASYQQKSTQLKYYNRYKILEPYVQDDWHVTKRLTLNLGLRVSMFGTYRDRYHDAYNFEPSAYTLANAPQLDDNDGTTTGQPGALLPGVGSAFDGIVQCGVGGSPPGCMSGHLWNPAPRIGFAFDPKGDGKTAIRAGYGIFYEHTNGNESNSEALEGSPPGTLNPQQFNIAGYGSIGGGLLFPLSVTAIPSNQAVWPYMQQYHFDIQHDFDRTLLTVSYVGSKGTHLPLQRDLNQLHTTPLSQNPYAPGQAISSADCKTLTDIGLPSVSATVNGNTITGQPAINLQTACGENANYYRPLYGFGTITQLENAADSSYNALQVSARRTIGKLNLSLAYTYAHSIDDSSDRFDANFVDSYNLRLTRASSNFDQRHILTISYVYDIPFFTRTGLAHAIFGGWQVSGITAVQSGTPFSVTNGGDIGDAAGAANGVGTGSFADVIGNPRTGFDREVGDDGPRMYNVAAYTDPRGLTFGDSGRNSLRLPSTTNFDAGLRKRVPIHEAVGFEFFWDVFNLFNHTEFNAVDGGFGSSTFLEATAAHRARTMQFGAKFTF